MTHELPGAIFSDKALADCDPKNSNEYNSAPISRAPQYNISVALSESTNRVSIIHEIQEGKCNAAYSPPTAGRGNSVPIVSAVAAMAFARYSCTFPRRGQLIPITTIDSEDAAVLAVGAWLNVLSLTKGWIWEDSKRM